MECLFFDITIGAVDGVLPCRIIPIDMFFDCLPLFLRSIEVNFDQVAAIIKHTRSHDGNFVSETHTGQLDATGERKIANGSDAIRDGHTGHFLTIIERIIRDQPGILVDSIGAVITIYSRDQHQIRIFNITKVFAISVLRILERRAVGEYMNTNGGYAVRDRYISQATAPIERKFENSGDTVRDSYIGQTTAIKERITPNLINIAEKNNVSQFFTKVECIFTNFRDSIR